MLEARQLLLARRPASRSTLPATKAVPVYDVRIDGDDVYVVMG